MSQQKTPNFGTFNLTYPTRNIGLSLSWSRFVALTILNHMKQKENHLDGISILYMTQSTAKPDQMIKLSF